MRYEIWLGMAIAALALAGCEGFTIDSVFPVSNESTPAIDLVQPEDGQQFLLGEPIEIVVEVDDGDDDPVDVAVLVLSDREGEICLIAPGVDGVAGCTAELGEGSHLLMVSAWDPLHAAEDDLVVEISVIDK